MEIMYRKNNNPENCKERRKNEIQYFFKEDILKNGFTINSQESFSSFLSLLKINGFKINQNLNFQDINNGKPFIIQSNTESNKDQYLIVVFIETDRGYSRLGYIDNNGNYEENVSRNYKPYINFPEFNQVSLEKRTDCKKETSTDAISATTREQQKEAEKYTIKRGDSLWKIISEKYGLTNPNDIANAIKAIKRVNKNKGIIRDNDVIFIGDTLDLPREINFRDKKFELKNK